MQHDPKWPFDAAAVATIGATFIGWLPSLTTAASLIWFLIRIYETKTVQRLLGRER